MKPTRNKFLIFLVTATILIIFAAIYVFLAIKRPNTGTSQTVDFEVSPGESLSEIGRNLNVSKLINSENLFRLYSHFDKRGNQIQTGFYKIPGNLTLDQLLNTLTKGPDDLRLTFIEGWRREEMANYFAEHVSSSNAYSDFLTASAPSEGYLFPDTYFVPQQVKATAVVDLLSRTFDSKITSDMKTAYENHGLTTAQAVTLASLVEREARLDTDRSLIAGIILNRLKADWYLNIDASVQYAKTSITCLGQASCDWWPTPTASDLEVNSPYNTYLNKGLPPSPICNPSLSALTAVAAPTVSNYYFYLSDKNGIFHYATTIEEHNQNIVKYL